MLDKEICRNCRLKIIKKYAPNVELEKIKNFYFSWENELVSCHKDSSVGFLSIKGLPPPKCEYLLEQLLIKELK